jgi:tetratricopeptide (TPR) repeat protein
MDGFTILVEEDCGERRWVRAAVGRGCTLGELADWLQSAFEVPQGAWSFTRAGRRPGDDASYTGPGDDVGRPGSEVELADLAWRPGARWVHRSTSQPFREREILVEALAESVDGVRELERGARGRTGELDAERLALRVQQVAAEWEREVEADLAPEPAVLRERAALALAAARWIGTQPDRQVLLELVADGDGLLWVLDLPSLLSEAGSHAPALELCESLAFVRGEQETRAERAFLLARAGRADEARALAERWLAEAPEDGWAWLLTGDVFALLGDGERALRGFERAGELADEDLELGVAVLERRLALARARPDAREAARLEAELEELQLAFEEQVGDDEFEFDDSFDLDDPAAAGSVGRNEPCPCGSGMKYKRCCGSAAAGPRNDSSRVVEFLDELAREADTPRLTRALQEALPRFAGEALAGIGVAAALPLLPRDDLPEALVHWAVLDCDLGDGTRVIERVLKRRRSGARERELFERLADSAASAWRVELLGDGDARLLDQLDAAADPVLLHDVSDLPQGAFVCARVLELDGERVLGPGTILLEGEAGERWLAGVRARLSELRAAEPQLEWRAFLRRHAHELYRPLTDVP